MNICDYIIKNNIPHTIENKKVVQNGDLNLTCNNITSLDGFVQNGYLFLYHNNISSLDGFVQNGCLDLSFNKITSLDGFVQNGCLFLNNNPIKNTETIFKNPKTGAFVVKWDNNLFGCGCFLGTYEELIAICEKKGFTEVIEHFKK